MMGSDTLSEAFVLNAGEARGPAPLNLFGDLVSIILSAADSADGVTILETVSRPQTGPPLHRHSRKHEWFYVLEGQFLFEVDGKQRTVSQGGSAFAPKGTIHMFQNIGSRLITVAQPDGIEIFLAELAAAIKDPNAPEIGSVSPIFEQYGLEFQGPPIAAREHATAAHD